MNSYFVNATMRTDEPTVVKAILLVGLFVMPWRKREIWAEHCNRMQRRLDNEREMGWGKRYIDGRTVAW